MDKLQLIGRYGESVSFSKEVNRNIVVKRQKSDRLVPQKKKQNNNGNNANNNTKSVGSNQVITTVNSININRAPLKEDVMQSAAEEEGKEVVLVKQIYELQKDYVTLVTTQFIWDTVPKKRA